jgi:site-specific recombinase XerD
MDNSMGAKWEKVKAKDGKMRSTKVMSVIAPDLVPYCLRHTYCTDLQAKGVNLKMASYLMGHADISVTGNIYTHVTESALNEAAALIGVTSGVTSPADGKIIA